MKFLKLSALIPSVVVFSATVHANEYSVVGAQ